MKSSTPSVIISLDVYNRLLDTEKEYTQKGIRKTTCIIYGFGIYACSSDIEATEKIIAQLEDATKRLINAEYNIKTIKKMSLFEFYRFKNNK